MTSKIEWTNRTWNIATGCAKVSPGCDRCYMHRLYPRLRSMRVPGYQADPDSVTIMPERLDIPLKIAKPSMFFVCSMSDLFHKDIPFDYIDRAWDTMALAVESRGHTFQILTKRPGRMLAWWRRHEAQEPEPWPAGIWAGVSVETARYRSRIAILSQLPAPVRFISAEPLLGPLDLNDELQNGRLTWVIAGGESGPGARPANHEWFRQLRDQCQTHEVAFFLKQLGGARDPQAGDKALLDGRRHQEYPPPR